MMSLLSENDDKPFVILEQLPLKKEYKKQFKDK